MILRDNLPNTNVSYGPPSVSNQAGITGAVNCSVVSSDLPVRPTAPGHHRAGRQLPGQRRGYPERVGAYTNPRAGVGSVCAVDPENNVAESSEGTTAARTP